MVIIINVVIIERYYIFKRVRNFNFVLIFLCIYIMYIKSNDILKIIYD